MKHITIKLTNHKGETEYEASHGIEEYEQNRLFDILNAFEDYLAFVHKIDPTKEALDLVSAVEL